jgi:hypothetical protein
MNNDRFGRTPDEVEDEARYAYAAGTIVLRAAADRLSAIYPEGKPIDRRDLRRLHERLYTVYELLGCQTVLGMGDEPATDAEQAANDRYRDTYSDGTLVSILLRSHNSRGWSASSEIYERDIPWLPNTTDNGDIAPFDIGPLPPDAK